MGLEPMTPAFERAKTIHALDSTAIVVGLYRVRQYNLKFSLIIPI
jgi:hypothetical protein